MQTAPPGGATTAAARVELLGAGEGPRQQVAAAHNTGAHLHDRQEPHHRARGGFPKYLAL